MPVATVLGEIFAGTLDDEIHRRYPSLPVGSIAVCMEWAIEALGDELRTRRALEILDRAPDVPPDEGDELPTPDGKENR